MTNEMGLAAGTECPGGVNERADAALLSMSTLRVLIAKKVEEAQGAPGWTEKGSDLVSLVRDLSKAITQVVELEGKVQDARRIEGGGVGLDLDAARSEIGRRLDLRAAVGRADGMDGGAE